MLASVRSQRRHLRQLVGVGVVVVCLVVVYSSFVDRPTAEDVAKQSEAARSAIVEEWAAKVHAIKQWQATGFATPKEIEDALLKLKESFVQQYPEIAAELAANPPAQTSPTSSSPASSSTSSAPSSPPPAPAQDDQARKPEDVTTRPAAPGPEASKWHGKPTVLRVIVITFNRAKSLQRLLESLLAADYGRPDENRVDLDIWIDHPADPNTPADGATVSAAMNCQWKAGIKTVHVRDRNAGLKLQWIDTWQPNDDTTEKAVILEDDVEVSPLFFRWLMKAYEAYGKRPELAGVTLARAELRARDNGRGSVSVDARHSIFMYLLVGSWGFSPAPKAWAQFRAWYHERVSNPSFHPYVDGLVTTEWYRVFENQGRAHTMWTQWFIRFCDERKLFTLYANLPQAFATNWREPGLHYHDAQGSVWPLVRDWQEGYIKFPDRPLYLGWDGEAMAFDPPAPSK